MKYSILFQMVLGATFCLGACESLRNPKAKPIVQEIEFVDYAMDSITVVKNISLNDLIKVHHGLDGQSIQTEGTVYFEFENVAICDDAVPSSMCFWLNLSRDLPINDSLLQLLSGQKLIIRGAIDNSRKGHLGAYLATIRNVYYLKTK